MLENDARRQSGRFFVPCPSMVKQPTRAQLRGAMGGYARAATLTPQRRAEIARDAANARWNGAPQPRAAWPWAPGTLAQGFLSSRWNRRNGGTGYRVPFTGTNSPIRGGDECLESRKQWTKLTTAKSLTP